MSDLIGNDLIDVFFDNLSDDERERLRETVDRLSTAIVDLIPFMNDDDGGGEVRVGAMLVGVGKKLAGVA